MTDLTVTQSVRAGIDSHRGTLLIVWLVGFFVAQALLFCIDVFNYHNYPGQTPLDFRQPIKDLYETVFFTYSGYVGGMLATFARRKSSKSGDSRSRFGLALGISIVWNACIAIPILLVLLQRLEIQFLTDWLQMFIKWNMFLATAVVAWYFSSNPS